MHGSARTAAHGDRVVVHVEGELDVYTVAPLRRELAAAVDAAADVTVDLSQVTFLDSTALGALISARKKVLAQGGRMELVIARESVLKVFRITALTQVFTIHPSLDAALSG